MDIWRGVAATAPRNKSSEIAQTATDAAAFGDAFDFGGADLAAGLHRPAGQHEFAALGGGGGDKRLEGGAEIARGAGAVEAEWLKFAAADQCEDGPLRVSVVMAAYCR
jgi:hypothetical protein